MRFKITILMLTGLLFSPFITLAQSDKVNYYFDEANEWFVFEWNRYDGGIGKTIVDPTTQIKPTIKSSVRSSGIGGKLTYHYEVSNGEGAKQPIHKIFLVYSSDVAGAAQPMIKNEWLVGKYRDLNLWHWAKIDGITHGILAGETETGLSLASSGLPAIADASFSGYRRVRYSIPGDEATIEVNRALNKALKKIKKEHPEKFKKVTRKTISPKDSSVDLKPAKFLDNIINMKEEAEDMGWISGNGIMKSLQVKLDNAKKSLEKGNESAAKNILEAFINEVEAQGCESYDDCTPGKHLKPEAYALLKYNVQYLIDKL